ncbi:SRRT [Branchiostoma lanceolatum]|uniref:SRRT protein n=1 Tax=Branchiostoma lanceolatum TaxID=7740 RepID=A0A8J9Z5D7_BRALA|nr:SRRT [Branchiostoma lanceolatum]
MLPNFSFPAVCLFAVTPDLVAMGDSDDEYDRRRGRDKFRRERSDYDRTRERDDRRRDDWSDRRRDSWDMQSRDRRRDYRDYDRGRRDRYSPPRHDMSPPMKRMRRDWDDGGYGPGYDMPGYGGPMHGPPQPWGHPMDMPMQHPNMMPPHSRLGMQGEVDQGHPQATMMTFKQFLGTQEDSIDDQEAIRKYNEYKVEFRRKQLEEFFIAHKEEEWFRSKFHPDECGLQKQEYLDATRKRFDVFMELLQTGWLDKVTVDLDKSEDITKLLDAAVIKIEGGTDHDLKILDQPPEPVRTRTASEGAKGRKGEPSSTPQGQTEAGKDEGGKAEGSTEDKPEEAGKEAEGGRRRIRRRIRKLIRRRVRRRVRRIIGSPQGCRKLQGKRNSRRPRSLQNCRRRPYSRTVKTRSRVLQVWKQRKLLWTKKILQQKKTDKEDAQDSTQQASEGKEKKEEEKEEAEEKLPETPSEPSPRPLHKTCSLFLRNIAPLITKAELVSSWCPYVPPPDTPPKPPSNIAPLITKAELVSMCKRFPGFLRVALSEPAPDRKFYRRGWITFDRSVNIKEICWNLQNIRLRDCELSPVVNRDLARRIRPVSGIVIHKQILRNDLRLAAKLVMILDARSKLWEDQGEEKGDQEKELWEDQGEEKGDQEKELWEDQGEEKGDQEKEVTSPVLYNTCPNSPVLTHLSLPVLTHLSLLNSPEPSCGRTRGRRRGIRRRRLTHLSLLTCPYLS